MKKRKSTGHTDVAVVYDGNHWRIVSPEGELACAASSVSRLPGELVSKMREVGVRSATVEYAAQGDFKACGCAYCGNTGYSGRTAIYEMLEVGEDVRKLLLKGESEDEIHRYLKNTAGELTLQGDALQKVLEGETTLEEYKAAVMEEI